MNKKVSLKLFIRGNLPPTSFCKLRRNKRHKLIILSLFWVWDVSLFYLLNTVMWEEICKTNNKTWKDCAAFHVSVVDLNTAHPFNQKTFWLMDGWGCIWNELIIFDTWQIKFYLYSFFVLWCSPVLDLSNLVLQPIWGCASNIRRTQASPNYTSFPSPKPPLTCPTPPWTAAFGKPTDGGIGKGTRVDVHIQHPVGFLELRCSSALLPF